MFFIILSFISGFVIGICLFYLFQMEEKDLDVKRTMNSIREEFDEYFKEIESDLHITCPSCRRPMNLDKRVISVESGEVIEWIYICPYCNLEEKVG